MAHVQPELNPFRSQRAVAFDATASQPRIEQSSAEPQSQLLLATSALARDSQQGEPRALEVLGFWGATVLFAHHLSLRDGFTIGESARDRTVDFEVAAGELGVPFLELLQTDNGVAYVLVPEAARVRVTQGHDPFSTHDVASSVALLPGTVVELEFQRLRFRIANVPAAARTPRAGLSSLERSVLTAFGLSFSLAAALISAFAFWAPPLGLTDSEELDRERIETMKQYLNAHAEPDNPAESGLSGARRSEAAASAAAASAHAGARGSLNAVTNNRRGAARGDAAQSPLSHSQMIEAARNFGMIELLGNMASRADGSSTFARDPTLGHDAIDAEGQLWGDPGDAAGVSGLNLIGTGTAFDGHGVGVGIDGKCLTGNCAGNGSGSNDGPGGIGTSYGRLTRPHATRGPRITAIGDSITSGHLPPEVVQRIVRQNYGRFRMCYENGLRANPNLTGRVSARFVIGREGAVTNVQNGGSDLPDGAVVSCVIQAFYGLSFPPPQNGIVTVTYPIFLSPG